MGTGVGVYFLLPVEPGLGMLGGLGAGICVCVLAAWRLGPGISPLFWAVALIGAGICVATLRSAWVGAPVLSYRYYGPIEGRIIHIDRSGSDAQRLTLDRVRLAGQRPHDTPERVRLSLHGDQKWLTPEPGMTVIATGHLAPPGGPVEPGGFDFRRHAWFARLGGVGYTRTPVLEWAPPEPGAVRVATWRRAIAARVQAGLKGETGAFAAAVMTGDRSGMGQGTLQALRASNLAHLLAISGLHMGLVAGFVFGAVRFCLAAWPWLALRVALHKVAALVSLAAAAGYLALSGGNVATERAFVMAAVALVAVLADRRAISLRAVALAALIVLTFRPEALPGPGFQMSFAATVGLVAVFSAIRDWRAQRPNDALPRWRKWIAPVLAVVISSAVAGAATAPVSATHFNQIARLGLLANVLAVPVMGAAVMPAAVVAACLMLIGFEAPALWVMGVGIDWVLGVAHWVAAQPGAVTQVPSPPAGVLPLMAFGGLVICLWQGRLRGLGVLPMVVAFWLWATTDRPAILVAEDGGLVGVMTDQGRALSRAKGGGFAARTWLENDGDPAEQGDAAARWAMVPNGMIRHVTGKKRAAGLLGCDGARLIVANAKVAPMQGCLVLDAPTLRKMGSVALWDTGNGWGLTPARTPGHVRPWSGQAAQTGRNRREKSHPRGQEQVSTRGPSRAP